MKNIKKLIESWLKVKMVFLKFKCLSCNEIFDFDAGSAKFVSKTKLQPENLVVCPKCKERGINNLDFIQTSEAERLYREYMEKIIRRMTIRKFRPGRVIAYSNIFGSAKQIELPIWGEKYTLVDLYCANPFCTCKEVFLDFFDQNCEKHGHFPKFSFKINYKSGIIEQTGGISESKAYETVEKFIPNLGVFESRHEELKNEVQPYILRRFKNHFIPTRKLGRNEPCHCGSGKKYKKCCLEEDIKNMAGGLEFQHDSK